MLVYTFILEYKGGTYISQLKAGDLKGALKKWADSLNVKEIKHLGEKSKTEIAERLEDEMPTAIKTMKNVWCLSFGINRGFMLLNIVQTAVTD